MLVLLRIAYGAIHISLLQSEKQKRGSVVFEKLKCSQLFFENIDKYKDELRSLLTDNFQIIGKQFSKT